MARIEETRLGDAVADALEDLLGTEQGASEEILNFHLSTGLLLDFRQPNVF